MKSQRLLLVLFVVYAAFTTPITSQSFAGDNGCSSEQRNESLYEMVPNIVLPQSIQYKPSTNSLTNPGMYVSNKYYPATYTAFPSYVLPYPTEIRSVQQALYPVTPPAPIQQGMSVPPMFPQYFNNPQPQVLIVAVPAEQPTPAVPDKIKSEESPEDSYDPDSDPLKLDVLHFYDLDLPEPDFGYNPTMNRSHILRPIRTAASRLTPSAFMLAQYQIPAVGSDAGYPNYANAVNPYGYGVEPKPLLPNAYAPQLPYPVTTYQYQQQQQQQYQYPAPQYGAQYPPQQNGNNVATEQPQVPNEVLNQIQQLITQNPNMQFTAVMMGPNGQLIPLGAGTNPQLGQQQGNQGNAWQQSMQQNQQAQLMQQQMQYIQAMNQYAQQATAAQNARQARGLFGRQQPVPVYGNYGGYGNYQPGVYPAMQQQAMQQPMPPQMQFVQPMPGMQNAYAMGNPYYMAMYGNMPMTSMYGPMMTPYGFGVMTNPYYPMMQQPGYMQPQQQQPRGFLDRWREKRRASERSMCDAWRTPHFPEESTMRLPAKDAYPWGYFGAQTADTQTANFGGYNGMYCGHTMYPGQ